MDGTTNFGGKVYISPTAVNEDMDLTAFQAVNDWVQLPNVGEVGDTGTEQNIVDYPTWDRRVTAKAKGQANAGDPTVECLDVPSDGMDAFLTAAEPSNQNNYPTKIEWENGDIEYNRGMVTGPTLPKGNNEGFKRAVFTLANQQVFIKDTVSSS